MFRALYLTCFAAASQSLVPKLDFQHAPQTGRRTRAPTTLVQLANPTITSDSLVNTAYDRSLLSSIRVNHSVQIQRHIQIVLLGHTAFYVGD